jgi:hypothetical protein
MQILWYFSTGQDSICKARKKENLSKYSFRVFRDFCIVNVRPDSAHPKAFLQHLEQLYKQPFPKFRGPDLK